MKPELVIIKDLPELEALEIYLKDFEYVAFDTETTGLNKSAEVLGVSICCEENKAFYIIHKGWDVESKTVKRIGIPLTVLTQTMELLKTKKLIAHNAVFDCAMVENYFKVSLIDSLHTDTMILAHLLDENRQVGLKELSKSMYGDDSTIEQQQMKDSVHANGGTLTTTQYEMFKADPMLMARYGAKDALLTFKLFIDLVPKLYDEGLDTFFYDDESMPLLKTATYQLNTVGMRVDQEKLAGLKKQLQIECIEAKAFIYQEIDQYIKDKYPGDKKKNTFNISSNLQLSWLLFGQMKLEFGTLTKAGKALCRSMDSKIPYTPVAKRNFIADVGASHNEILQPEAIINGKKIAAKKVKEVWSYIACDKFVLQRYAPKYKWIEKLVEYQRKTKLLNTYIEGIESRLEYAILQGSFLQHGTTSGRYASRNPNLQNLPRDDKRIKDCIISRKGKVFVGADFSQLEVRVFASVSQDADLLRSFRSGEDFYSVIGMAVFNKYDAEPTKEGSDQSFGIKYKELRKAAKELALASTYGASAWQLKSKLNKSEEDTQTDIDNYFESFPGVAKMMLDSHELAKTNGEVTSIYGRKRRLPDALRITRLYGNQKHKDLPYEIRSQLNLAVNHRIQSTAASVCNRAMIKFCNDVRLLGLKNCFLISQIHDEIIAECDEADAETVSVLLQDAMEHAVELPGVALEAIPNIGKTMASLK